jgi:hypothetical protein
MATKTIKKRVTSQSIRENSKKDHSPKWDNVENLNAEEFLKKFHQAMDWYRLESGNKNYKPWVIDWMSRNSYDTETIAQFKKTKDWRCTGTMGAIAACLMKGMPAQVTGFNNNKNSAEWLGLEITRVIEDGKYDIEVVEEVVKTKIEIPVVTIQDRIRDQAVGMSEEIDQAIDEWVKDPEAFDPKGFKMVSLLRGKGAKAAQARYIKSFFEAGHNELLELASGDADEQLREAYSHNSRKNVKKLIEFYEAIKTSCDTIIAEAKVLKKVRPKKAKPAEELVKKLKFQMSDDKLSITSVPPAQLIGASGAVVYNTKNRKIGYYIAKTTEGLTVKNSSILNFTEKSVQRTLRKPEVQIKEFKDQNTQKRFETWFEKIKTTDIALTGRISEDVIILKVYK